MLGKFGMVKPLISTIKLIAFCSVLICAAKAIGNLNENPLTGWFTNSDGSVCTMPCLFGIQPGITQYEDAIKIIQLHPVTRSMQKDYKELGVTLQNSHFCV